MKKQTFALICSIVVVEALLILLVGCKKDEKKENSNPTNIILVNIPEGTFVMGSPTTEINHDIDENVHQVTLSAFRMSKYEISNAQYAKFLNTKNIDGTGIYGAGAYPTHPLIYASKNDTDWGLHYNGSQWLPVPGYENYPAIYVTWYGATEFATYAGGSLPTEAQWEYACRGTTQTPFNTGICLSDTQANYNWQNPYNTCTNTITISSGKTLTVGTYAANAYGLYDMHGNVWEWCSDWYGTYPAISQTNPTGASTGHGRVIRGGSWNLMALECRSADRYYFSEYVFGNFIGFRVILVP